MAHDCNCFGKKNVDCYAEQEREPKSLTKHEIERAKNSLKDLTEHKRIGCSVVAMHMLDYETVAVAATPHCAEVIVQALNHIRKPAWQRLLNRVFKESR